MGQSPTAKRGRNFWVGQAHETTNQFEALIIFEYYTNFPKFNKNKNYLISNYAHERGTRSPSMQWHPSGHD